MGPDTCSREGDAHAPQACTATPPGTPHGASWPESRLQDSLTLPPRRGIRGSHSPDASEAALGSLHPTPHVPILTRSPLMPMSPLKPGKPSSP